MHILNLFEAVYKSHVLSLVKKGLECVVLVLKMLSKTMEALRSDKPTGC